jgi:hypothetical protein
MGEASVGQHRHTLPQDQLAGPAASLRFEWRGLRKMFARVVHIRRGCRNLGSSELVVMGCGLHSSKPCTHGPHGRPSGNVPASRNPGVASNAFGCRPSAQHAVCKMDQKDQTHYSQETVPPPRPWLTKQQHLFVSDYSHPPGSNMQCRSTATAMSIHTEAPRQLQQKGWHMPMVARPCT